MFSKMEGKNQKLLTYRDLHNKYPQRDVLRRFFLALTILIN